MMKKIAMIGLLCFTLITAAWAQEEQRTLDAFGTHSVLNSDASFDFKQLPASGPVRYSKRLVQNGQLRSYKLSGRTSAHLPVGKWRFMEATWRYDIALSSKAAPVFTATGKRMSWEGTYNEGLPDGRWTFVVDSVTHDEKLIKSLIKLELNYREGIPVGVFTLENNSTGNALKVKGQTDASGFATGTWKAQYLTVDRVAEQEERIYRNGLLVSVHTMDQGRRSEKVIAHNVSFLAQPALNEHRRIGAHRFIEDESGTLAAVLTQKSLNDYFATAWSLSEFPLELNFYIPSFRRLEYPLSKEEQLAIANAKALIRSQKMRIEKSLNTNVNILRSRSAELDTSIAYLQLRDKRLDFTDSLLLRVDAALFTYKNRYQQGLDLWIDGLNNMRTANGTVHDSIMITLPEMRVATYGPNVFEALNQYLIHSAEALNVYVAKVDQASLDLHQEGELKALEDTIGLRLTELTAYYEKEQGFGKVLYERWLKGNAQNRLQAYAATEDHDNALALGRSIVAMLDSLDTWKTKLPLLDSMPQALKTQYSYMAYNPYTGAKDIEVITKRRFINNILEDLWPYMAADLEQEQDWEALNKKWERQFAVFKYLIGFADRDDNNARRLEQKVRKEKKAERMLRHIQAEL